MDQLVQILKKRRTGPASSSNTTPAPSRPRTPAHKIRFVPHLESRRCLKFQPISRSAKPGAAPIPIGRYIPPTLSITEVDDGADKRRIAFKSKVVSRTHAEIWADNSGQFWIRDTKSSTGTFLNRRRLSPANIESDAFELKDGDILQLGVDYQRGEEDVYKSVRIRIEIGREWQMGANPFNTASLQTLESLATQTHNHSSKGPATLPKFSIPDCCICLFSVTIQQALFISPCSHTFHYKCVRSLLQDHHPSFSCPLCRAYTDLDDDVDVDTNEQLELASSVELCPRDAATTEEGEEQRIQNETDDLLIETVPSAPVFDGNEEPEAAGNDKESMMGRLIRRRAIDR